MTQGYARIYTVPVAGARGAIIHAFAKASACGASFIIHHSLFTIHYNEFESEGRGIPFHAMLYQMRQQSVPEFGFKPGTLGWHHIPAVGNIE